MRIGIMTFHASHNCGSMLQAFALQQTLINKYGAEVEIINFSNKAQRNLYSLIDLRLRPSALRNNVKSLPYLKWIKKYHKDYEEFFENYFIVSEGDYSKLAELECLDGKYDVVIAGGDQVWNLKCWDADDAYFLPFIKNGKKIAYSPSLGAMNILKYADDTARYKKYLCEFSDLSVREPNGKKWLEELTGRDIPIICDPTMLFTSDEWLEMLPTVDIKEDFIFYYAFDYSEKEQKESIQEFSKKMNMPVYLIDTRHWYIHRLDKYGVKLYEKSGPLAFLTMIKNAKFVVTQSFHGTLFSALFNKQFWSCRNVIEHNKDDDRSMALLKSLGLEERFKIITEIVDLDKNYQIDYTEVNRKIVELRNKGLEYLNRCLIEEN